MSIHAKLTWTGIVVLPIFLLGCGGEQKAEITGKATYKSKPVAAGSVSFHMTEKGIAQDAKLDSGGMFTMPATLPVGTYKVYYVPPTPEPQDPSKVGRSPVIPIVVPKKHHDLKTSNLSVEIKAGKNEIPIEFTD